jgi:hypothetical protein
VTCTVACPSHCPSQCDEGNMTLCEEAADQSAITEDGTSVLRKPHVLAPHSISPHISPIGTGTGQTDLNIKQVCHLWTSCRRLEFSVCIVAACGPPSPDFGCSRSLQMRFRQAKAWRMATLASGRRSECLVKLGNLDTGGV